MRIVREEILINEGGFCGSDAYRNLLGDIRVAVRKVVWPPGASTFTIHPETKGNGVVPIKEGFQAHLEDQGWLLEHRLDLGATRKRPGPLDVVKPLGSKYFAVEWETGNISSSHRAVNKIIIGILNGVLEGGALVLPTRNLYRYLTDRIGNYEELEPYFPVWRAVECSAGLLLIVAIEHDDASLEVARIEKGTDGRAMR